MHTIKSIIESEGDATIVNVECHLANSLPSIVIVGFAHRSIAEARERIRGALASCGLKLPAKRIILNLAPADIPKEGSAFDLPILIAILLAAKHNLRAPAGRTAIMGEVGLDGSIRPIRGIIGKILAAKQCGLTEFWIPADNLPQARLVPGVTLYSFRTVGQLYASLRHNKLPPPIRNSAQISINTPHLAAQEPIEGHPRAKRVLLIAAAGHHHLLLSGLPGTGKTMLARSINSIMPPLSLQEMLDVTHLHSLNAKNFDRLVAARPFRSPHHSASLRSIIGGGSSPLPGEVSLSHHGVLFLDELPEFSHSALEALRQPLEDGYVTIARSKGIAKFPARFLLVATANPCACGYYGTNRCTCSGVRVAQYQRKISGPIMDRIDLYCEVEAVPSTQLLMSHNLSTTQDYANQVAQTRARQYKIRGKLNSEMTLHDLQSIGNITPQAEQLLNTAATRLRLSSRSYIRALRVSRTIADLAANNNVTDEHVSEALQYRMQHS